MAGKPCKADCTCGRHVKTPEHRARLSVSVKLTCEAKKGKK